MKYLYNLVLLAIGPFVVDCAAPPTYKVAVMFNNFGSTGDLDKNGLQYKAAMLMAFNEINDKTDGLYDDLLPNTTFSLLTAQPSQSKTSGAIESLNAINSGARACLGPQESSPIEGGGKLLMENGVLQIGYHAQEDDLTNRVYNNFVRTNPPRAQEGYVMPMLTYEKFHWARVAFVKAYTTFGFHCSFKYDIYFTDKLGLPQTDIERSDHIIYPIQKDYTGVIQEIKNTKFNILALFADGDHGSAFLSAAYKAGLIHSKMQLIIASDITSKVAFDTFLSNGLTDTDVSILLTGAISFLPTLNRSKTEAQHFVHRFRSQPNSLGNGTHCDQSQDVDGNFINQNADGSVCAGLNFSNFEPSGSDITKDAFYAYDAVLTLAKGLHRYIHIEHLESLISTPYHYYYLMQSLNYVDFEGASGHVAFEPFPDRQNNDRLVDILYEVYNFHPDIYLNVKSVDPTKGFVKVGYINTDTGFYSCEHDTDKENCHEFVFKTDSANPPSDRPVLEVLYMPQTLKGLLYGFAGVTILIVVVLATSVLIFRERRLIRILQPEFGTLVTTGCLLLAANAIVNAHDVTKKVCLTSFCLSHLGFCLVVSPLVAKTARINIVLNGKLRKVKITLWQTFALALVMLTPMIICTTIYASNHNNFSVGHQTITNSLTTRTEEELCKQVPSGTVYFMYAYEAFLMVVALLLCYPIRNLPAGISDVKEMAKASVVIVSYTAVLLIILRVFDNIFYPSTTRFLIAITEVFTAARVILFMYAGAVIESYQGYDLNDKFQLTKIHESLILGSGGVLSKLREQVSSKGSGSRVAPDREPNRSRAPHSHEERIDIVLQINRLNQRLTDIANKQLYDDKMSIAILPPDIANALGSVQEDSAQEEHEYIQDRSSHTTDEERRVNSSRPCDAWHTPEVSGNEKF